MVNNQTPQNLTYEIQLLRIIHFDVIYVVMVVAVGGGRGSIEMLTPFHG